MKRRLTIVFLLVMCLVFTGTISANEPVKITNVTGWGGLVYDVYEGFVEEFNNSQDEVEVELIYGGSGGQAGQKVEAMIASGDTPDLYEIGAQYLAPYTDADVIIPMEELIKEDPDVSMDDFYQSQIDQWTYDGKMRTMPWYASVPVWAYNKEVFEENGVDPDNPPNTWEEFLPALKKVHVQSGKQFRYGVVWTRTLWFYRVFLHQGGGHMLNKNNGRDGLADAAVFDQYPEGIEFWASLQRDHNVASYLPRGQINNVFLGGKSASVLASTSSSQQLIEGADFEVGFAPIPYNKERGQRLPMGAISLAMFRTTPEREEATWKFVKWLHQPEQRARWVKEVGNQSPSKVAVELLEEEGFFEENPHQKMFAEQLGKTYPDAVHPRFPDIYTIFVDTVEPVFLGQMEVDEALEMGEKRATKVLMEYKEQHQ